MQAHINKAFFTKPLEAFNEIMESLGASSDSYSPDEFGFDAPYLWPNRFLQMCPPSIMYPRSDAPSSFRYAGGLPRLGPKTNSSFEEKSLPSWWEAEVVHRPSSQKVVFVCQGTVIFDYTALVLPTIEALKDRPDTLVVAVLGLKGATLPSDLLPGGVVPANVRVVDYLPYDAILPLADVFVGNGGYGGVIHSVSHGTPMVLAGDTEDKAEMCAITAWCGAAVNLRTGRPSVEDVRRGVEEVLTNDKYTRTCVKIKEEMERFDPLRVIEETVDELVREAGFRGEVAGTGN